MAENPETMAHVRVLGNLRGTLERARVSIAKDKKYRASAKAMHLAELDQQIEALDKAVAALIARDG